MKNKLLLITIISSFLLSCNTGRLISNEKVWVGMTIQEFMQNNSGASTEYMDKDMTIYKIVYHQYKDGFFAQEYVDQVKFYYFQNSKLVKIDTGQLRQERYQYEIINR